MRHYPIYTDVATAVLSPAELEVQLKNAVFKELLQVYHQGGVASSIETPPLHKKEPLDFVRQVQEDWESKVRRGINALCTERSLVLAREVRLSNCGVVWQRVVDICVVLSPASMTRVTEHASCLSFTSE